MARDIRLTRKRDMTRLRGRMDGNDGFMSAHQIKKVRVLIGQKDTPPWSASDVEVRRVLLTTFPRLKTNYRERQAAARWNRAIMLVYRMGMPYNHAAAELGIKVGTLRSLLRNIRRAAKGLRSDTNTPRKGGPGRPNIVN
jgi:hypothetical protein